MNLLREYIRELLEQEQATQGKSPLSSVADFVKSQHYDDVMDSAFRRIAPNMVRHVLEREINEDVTEFTDGAIEGRFERKADWAAEDPSPQEFGSPADSTDYKLGYTWGWNNADSWEGNTLPSYARKEAVEAQIKEFENQVSEQMVIAALEAANDKVNPIKLLGKAKDAIHAAVQEDGWIGGLKKGLPIAVGIIVGEALDNFIIPMAFYSLTGIPIPPLPIGVGEIINPVVINMVGASTETEELADELGWYEDEYGKTSALPPKEIAELREYIRSLLLEDEAGRKQLAKDLAAAGTKENNPTPSVSATAEEHVGLVKQARSQGRDLKKAFAKNADRAFLDSLVTVHWFKHKKTMEAFIEGSFSSRDELSASAYLPGEIKGAGKFGDYGILIKGYITLLANDMDQLYTGGTLAYEEVYPDMKKQSGINKGVQSTYNPEAYEEYKILVLDEEDWDPSFGGFRSSQNNEALVDNWSPMAIIVPDSSNQPGYWDEDLLKMEPAAPDTAEADIVWQPLLDKVGLDIPVMTTRELASRSWT